MSGEVLTAVLTVAASLVTWLVTTLLSGRSETRRRLDGLEAREMVLHDYIYVLRQHIANGKPPPPPPWPSVLTRGVLHND